MADDDYFDFVNSQTNNGQMEGSGENGTHEEEPPVTENGGLVEFIMQEVQRQKMQVVDIEDADNEQQEQAPEVDATRERNFVTSALSAIHKMNAEVDKSKRKQEQLHARFGAQRYAEWQAEHAAQVLTPAEANLVANNKIV